MKAEHLDQQMVDWLVYSMAGTKERQLVDRRAGLWAAVTVALLADQMADRSDIWKAVTMAVTSATRMADLMVASMANLSALWKAETLAVVMVAQWEKMKVSHLA